jgi:hypothetical protein
MVASYRGISLKSALIFCTDFMSVDKPIGVLVNKHGDRLAGMGHKHGKKDINMLRTDPPRYDDHIGVHTVLLQHLAAGRLYSKRHKSLVKEENP